jgi:recombinase-like protein
VEYNPFLRRAAARARGSVEQRHNIEWQNRFEAPSPFEERIADALEKIFAKGIDELPGVVRELNQAAVRDRDGNAWTEESFQAEMKRLGG